MPRKAVSAKRERRCACLGRKRKRLKCRKARRRCKIKRAKALRWCKIKRAKALMYGYDGRLWRPVLVNQRGNLTVTKASAAPSRMFLEEIYPNISAQNDWHPLPPQETSVQTTYSYAVINRSSNTAVVRIEISPDGANYAVDREETVLPGETKALVPTRFLKYTRLSVRAASPGEMVRIDAFYQAQSIA